MWSDVIGASRVAFLVKFAEDPLYDRRNGTGFDGDGTDKAGSDDDLGAQDAWIESISMTGRVKIRFRFPMIVQDDVSKMKERARG